jgi:hypothetical protein
MGSSTIETFQAQLQELRLGSKGCKNPSDFNAQFDRFAALAFPHMKVGQSVDLDSAAVLTVARVLGNEYSAIIRKSDHELWKMIQRGAAPKTMEAWKEALARFWSAERIIDYEEKQRAKQQLYRGRGSTTMRGGYGRGGGYHGSAPISVNAISDSGASMEGEEYTTEGEPDPQLSAVSSSGRGGRGGGRGGASRGHGGMWSGERQKLYEEQKCFNCKKPGHVRAACTMPPTPRPQQSNEKADQ